jgi:hypothetical protein
MIKEFDVTLRVAIDISAYDCGASGKQIVPTIHNINGVRMGGYLVAAYDVVKDQIFETLANDDPAYNEAIMVAMEEAEDRSVRDERD